MENGRYSAGHQSFFDEDGLGILTGLRSSHPVEVYDIYETSASTGLFDGGAHLDTRSEATEFLGIKERIIRCT